MKGGENVISHTHIVSILRRDVNVTYSNLVIELPVKVRRNHSVFPRPTTELQKKQPQVKQMKFQFRIPTILQSDNFRWSL